MAEAFPCQGQVQRDRGRALALARIKRAAARFLDCATPRKVRLTMEPWTHRRRPDDAEAGAQGDRRGFREGGRRPLCEVTGQPSQALAGSTI
jgi:hypothetical protein